MESLRRDEQALVLFVVHLLDACLEARDATGDDRWVAEARRCFDWFLGRNDLELTLYDDQTGGCRDCLVADGLHPNQSAESTLAWLLSLLAIRSFEAGDEALGIELAAPELVLSDLPQFDFIDDSDRVLVSYSDQNGS